MNQRLLIVQPYVPEYRVPLFGLMREMLAERGIDVAVAAARPNAEQAARGDDFSQQAAEFELIERRRGIGSKSIISRDLMPVLESFQPDFVIVEQAIKNFENWKLLLRRSRRNVAMWGQGSSYSTKQSPVEATAKQWLTKQSDWFFAYTQGGADHVIKHGFPASRITVLHNATDTASLRRDLGSIEESEIMAFRKVHGLRKGFTALFIGGVDERKGIPFLLEAARLIHKGIPEFRLLIAGIGRMSPEVIAAQERGDPLVYLARVSGHEKALALAASSLVLIPEWVGLAAVDALAAGRPVVTTHHHSHSPEVEYLLAGQNSLFTPYRVDDYAGEVIALLEEDSKLVSLSVAAELTGNELSIEEMANRFVFGIQDWIFHNNYSQPKVKN